MSQALIQMMCKSLNFVSTVEVHGGLLVFKDQTGQVKLSVAPDLLPFIDPGTDGALICINVVKAGVQEVQEQSSLIIPDKRIIRPS